MTRYREPLGFALQLFAPRQSGVAAALIADAEVRLAQRSVETAWLACAIGNYRAARFYEKSGWYMAGRFVVASETSIAPFPVEHRRYESGSLVQHEHFRGEGRDFRKCAHGCLNPAVQQVCSYAGYTGRGAYAIGKAAGDPTRTLRSGAALPYEGVSLPLEGRLSSSMIQLATETENFQTCCLAL